MGWPRWGNVIRTHTGPLEESADHRLHGSVEQPLLRQQSKSAGLSNNQEPTDDPLFRGGQTRSAMLLID